jgi:hypothetical protein
VGIIGVLLALAGASPVLGSATGFNPNGLKIFPVEGVQFSGTIADFEDPGAPPHASYKVAIDWGDGTASDGSTTDLGKNKWEATGKHTYAEEGHYDLRVSITGGSGSGTASPTAEVSDAPLTAKVAVPPVAEGSVLNAAIATFTDADPNDAANEYTVTINWGDGGTAPGAVTRTGAGAFSVSGNHTYGDEGSRTVGVTVHDAGGSTVTASQTISVADAPLTPGATVTRRGVEGRPLAGVVATFHDGFTGATAADYTGATINWGDRTSSAGTISPAPGGGWQVGGSHAYREEGSYTTIVVVNDRGGATVTLHGNAFIGDAPLRARGRRITGRLAFRGVVATFTDAAGRSAKPSDHTGTINWGDGHSSAGRIARTRDGFAVTGAHAYASAGLKHVTVSIRDRGGARATARSQVTISA